MYLNIKTLLNFLQVRLFLIHSILKDTKEDFMENKYDLFGKCPFAAAQKVISGKWAVIILHNLSLGTLRFGELQRLLPDLTQSTLTKQLRSLEGHGLVKRYVFPQVPPKVEYSLTDIGKEFQIVLDSISVWGEKYIEYMKIAEVTQK